jgi:hypothetical protein
MDRYYSVYNPKSKQPFKLSRSKIDMFIQCPRCFYIDRRLGIPRPSMPGFTLNVAVDALLKNEFDILRKKGEAHALMQKYGIKAIPFAHPDMDTWRNNFVGKQYLHEQTNFLVFGSIDDLWINPKEELHIVDYKSTSTQNEISLEDKYKQSYKRQAEIYQWIYRQSGFKVSDTAYFVFANATKDRAKFDGKLTFDLSILSYKGSDAWVEQTLLDMKKCLDGDKMPNPAKDCEYCAYRKAVKETIEK